MVVRKRFIALLMVTLPVAATLYAVFIHVRTPAEQVIDTVRAPAAADVFLRNATLTETDAEGQPVFQVNARDVIYFNDRSVKLAGVTVNHMGGDNGAWVVNADDGYIPPSTRDIRLSGNVRMRGSAPRGNTINVTTAEIWVRSGRKSLETDKPVTIQSDDRQIRATGMVTDWAAGSMRLRRRVRARYQPTALNTSADGNG